MDTSSELNTPSAMRLTQISVAALILGHLFTRTYAVWMGLIIVPLFIYRFTLRKNDLFSFLMVIYFCGTFPYMVLEGGAFNMVGFMCIGYYCLSKNGFPSEIKIRDKWFKLFVGLVVIASVLGWLINYTGEGLEFVYSFLSFFGIILLLLFASRIEITAERMKVFLQLNMFLIIWSSFLSINKYLEIIHLPIDSPLMPKYGRDMGYFEGGGVIGSSPLYGEHSMILLMLFLVFLIFNNHTVNINKFILLAASIISFVNVFMSISRSVLILSAFGVFLVFLLQAKLIRFSMINLFQQIVMLFLIPFFVFYIIQASGINYTLERMNEISERNKKSGGITIERVLDGSAINRADAFEEGIKRFESKGTWLIGYGWGLERNNRQAFYVNPKIDRGSAHSQVLAILFLFGWIGFIGYWGLIFRIIFKAYKTCGYENIDFINRIMACFFLIAFILFVLNEIKVDSISFPTYFTVTIIWMGMAYSANNCKISNSYTNRTSQGEVNDSLGNSQ